MGCVVVPLVLFWCSPTCNGLWCAWICSHLAENCRKLNSAWPKNWNLNGSGRNNSCLYHYELLNFRNVKSDIFTDDNNDSPSLSSVASTLESWIAFLLHFLTKPPTLGNALDHAGMMDNCKESGTGTRFKAIFTAALNTGWYLSTMTVLSTVQAFLAGFFECQDWTNWASVEGSTLART